MSARSRWWWLTFTEHDKLFGIILVKARTLDQAIEQMDDLEIRPRGELHVASIPGYCRIPAEAVDRRLTRVMATRLLGGAEAPRTGHEAVKRGMLTKMQAIEWGQM